MWRAAEEPHRRPRVASPPSAGLRGEGLRAEPGAGRSNPLSVGSGWRVERHEAGAPWRPRSDRERGGNPRAQRWPPLACPRPKGKSPLRRRWRRARADGGHRRRLRSVHLAAADSMTIGAVLTFSALQRGLAPQRKGKSTAWAEASVNGSRKAAHGTAQAPQVARMSSPMRCRRAGAPHCWALLGGRGGQVAPSFSARQRQRQAFSVCASLANGTS